MRHTKNQIIAGKAALKLPSMPVSTLSVSLSSPERKAYNSLRWQMRLKLRKLMFGSTARQYYSASYLDRAFSQLRQASNQPSKYHALFANIRDLLKTDENARVVIFSRYMDSIDELLRSLAKPDSGLRNVSVTQIRGSVTPKIRQRAIRNFQDTANRCPRILVISYITGECGITLTAASRIYLLEPCILPSDEVQAGGRIHRVGQTKRVELVRCVAKETCDEAIVKFHAKLASGQREYQLDGQGSVPCRFLNLF